MPVDTPILLLFCYARRFCYARLCNGLRLVVVVVVVVVVRVMAVVSMVPSETGLGHLGLGHLGRLLLLGSGADPVGLVARLEGLTLLLQLVARSGLDTNPASVDSQRRVLNGGLVKEQHGCGTADMGVAALFARDRVQIFFSQSVLTHGPTFGDPLASLVGMCVLGIARSAQGLGVEAVVSVAAFPAHVPNVAVIVVHLDRQRDMRPTSLAIREPHASIADEVRMGADQSHP